MRKLIMFLFSIVLCVCALAMGGCQDQEQNVASNREHSETWVKDTLPGYTMVGFSSASLDADGDGYVSTDITVQKDGTSEMTLIQLDCPTKGQPLALQRGQGCKYKQMAFTPRF